MAFRRRLPVQVAVDSMDQPLVLRSDQEHVAILTLNHPQKRNALSCALLAALRDHLKEIAGDRNIRVVALKAAGPVFSAGHDLRELTAGTTEDHTAVFNLCTEVMERIRTLPQPVIAAVQGLATAAGCQLAATCDLVVAAEDAAFATPGVKIGLFCTTPAVPLVRAVPTKKAMEMLLTGDPISAREAERIGLVNRVVPLAELDQSVLLLAAQIARAAPAVVALGKRAFYQQSPLDSPQAYAITQPVMIANASLAEAQEGMRRFLEKRR